jgi:hypothetical protein
MNKFCRCKADGDVRKRSMFVGVDAHENYLQVVVLDEKRKYWTVQEQTITWPK